jgi:glyoxylase-like metal-dependent hydrolase (beta-lactamase superfamily II)
MKQALGIKRIEMLIITHYHGDHLENIPDLVEADRTEVVCLHSVAEVVMYPSRFNLCCTLPWYESMHDTVRVDRVVKDGERIRWHEYELEIFDLGGQTRYHAGIETTVDGQKVIFTGDAISMNARAEPPLCYNDCNPATVGWAAATKRLLDRKPDVLVGGHGSFCREPGQMLNRKHMNWQLRLQQFDALDYRGNRELFFNPFVAG